MKFLILLLFAINLFSQTESFHDIKNKVQVTVPNSWKKLDYPVGEEIVFEVIDDKKQKIAIVFFPKSSIEEQIQKISAAGNPNTFPTPMDVGGREYLKLDFAKSCVSCAPNNLIEGIYLTKVGDEIAKIIIFTEAAELQNSILKSIKFNPESIFNVPNAKTRTKTDSNFGITLNYSPEVVVNFGQSAGNLMISCFTTGSKSLTSKKNSPANQFNINGMKDKKFDDYYAERNKSLKNLISECTPSELQIGKYKAKRCLWLGKTRYYVEDKNNLFELVYDDSFLVGTPEEKELSKKLFAKTLADIFFTE